MIAYNLVCKDGHEFEGWFASSNAFAAQEKAGDLICPICGDPHVSKAIMAPAVKTSVTKAKGRATPPEVAPDQQKLRQFVAGFRKYVEENADYVGPQFPEEARKIHYGEAEFAPHLRREHDSRGSRADRRGHRDRSAAARSERPELGFPHSLRGLFAQIRVPKQTSRTCAVWPPVFGHCHKLGRCRTLVEFLDPLHGCQ